MDNLPEGKIDVDTFRKWRRDSYGCIESHDKYKGATKLLECFRKSEVPIGEIKYNEVMRLVNAHETVAGGRM